ncbi:hypothetical protein [Stenoxybacter acetivorans]|uniref:hypothetical protein n=1 Tax=Stenoxybacter acetivorans TaxID=422441 RepID=UPI00056A76C1|nr:hypothetical protein [Stenoxybacter acetivorans]
MKIPVKIPVKTPFLLIGCYVAVETELFRQLDLSHADMVNVPDDVSHVIGYFLPGGTFHAVECFFDYEAAEKQVAYLNGRVTAIPTPETSTLAV